MALDEKDKLSDALYLARVKELLWALFEANQSIKHGKILDIEQRLFSMLRVAKFINGENVKNDE